MTSSSGESSSLLPLDWKFSQVFGERVPGEDVQDVDVISAIEFDKSGDFLAVGDRGGRVVIFERKDRKKVRIFISLVEIEEKINRIKWCTTPNGSLFILSTNDKTIKLWKVKEHKCKKVKETDADSVVYSESALLAEKSFSSELQKPSTVNGRHLEWTGDIVKNISPFQEGHTKIAHAEDTTRASCRKVYAHAHDFNINSISNNSDGETFISADDLRINLWNLEISNQCFNIIDMKPANMEDLTEVITSAEFHPIYCNMLAYSSSRGFIRLVDMRQSALCDQSAMILQDADCHEPKSFFTEIIASISDMKFTNDGQHILSRDYLNLKLWDMRKNALPVAIFKIHEHLQPKLCDLYNNDSIFDKFECCISGDGLHFATGSYSNLLRIFSYGVGSEEGVTVEANKDPSRKALLYSTSRARRSSLSNLTRGFYRHGHENSINEFSCDLSSKLLHLAWHPTSNLIACASGNSLYMYYA
ncbi:serine/threonine protein phosphatase 2A 55 kDa regulatory subunit B beta isoform [Jatropha curcas]|uniref:serine/threonine protein phosphatase 2A 55 kDa regulatory subunit B beta isoform n=1 Tax=Jatropha curcas TaxID=180498 RepID=UPI001894D259|nr:serine/threonine protein phosphatase 2A 55 kDa regulatory subunit B beta isoform [Jatropha curcas]